MPRRRLASRLEVITSMTATWREGNLAQKQYGPEEFEASGPQEERCYFVWRKEISLLVVKSSTCR